MLSYTGARNLYKDLTGNDSTSNLSFGDVLINGFIRSYATFNGGKWWFLEKVTTQSTVANQQGYTIPQSTRKIIDLYVTVGTTVYSPIAVESAEMWKRVLQYQLGVGDRALFYYRQGNQVLLAPTPGSNGNTITIRTRKNVKDLSIADYTTGTVTVTSADATVAGAGTTFTALMEGRYLRATTGDMEWYEIADFTNTTSLELVSAYAGDTVAGSAFIIGEMPILPEAYHPMPVYKAAATYWQKEGEQSRARTLEDLALSLYDQMLQEAGEKTEGAYMMPVDSLTWRDPNIPEPDVSSSSFT